MCTALITSKSRYIHCNRGHDPGRESLCVFTDTNKEVDSEIITLPGWKRLNGHLYGYLCWNYSSPKTHKHLCGSLQRRVLRKTVGCRARLIGWSTYLGCRFKTDMKNHVNIILSIQTSVREAGLLYISVHICLYEKHVPAFIHISTCSKRGRKWHEHFLFVSAVWLFLLHTVMIFKNVLLDLVDRCSCSFRADNSASLEFCCLLLVWKLKVLLVGIYCNMTLYCVEAFNLI